VGLVAWKHVHRGAHPAARGRWRGSRCTVTLTRRKDRVRQVARKQMYRATVVQKVGTLRVLDNREVTLEERERVDCLFGLDSRAAGPRP
jgi:hypothetical protein